jgi:signal transduction histidine kinase
VVQGTSELAADRLRKLLLVTDTALSHLSLDALLDELLERIRDALEADTVAVLLLDEDSGELVASAAKGLEEEVERGIRIPLGRGFAGRVAADRRPVALEDVDQADVLNPLLREKGVKSLLGVPLLAHGGVLGVVHVGTLKPRRFGRDDVQLLQLAADRAALAIDRVRLYEAQHVATDQLRKLLLVTDAALSHLSLDALLDELLERIRDILDADTAACLMLDEPAHELVARAAKGLEEEVERGVRLPVGRGFAGRIAAEQRPIAIADVDHADVLNPLLREKGIKSLLGAPLMARGRVLGVIHVGTLTPRVFGAEDAELLQRAAERAALGVERALLHDELRQLDQVREQFVARASHELRTPAAAVYGATETLRRRSGRLAPEQVQALEATVYEQSARLAELIEKLLDVSRVEAHAVEIKPQRLRLQEVLENLVSAFGDSTEIQLRVPAGLEAEADPVAVDRVVTNLVINAIRHGAPPILVSAERTSEELRIAVEDGGPGVPADVRAQLFEQFARSASSAVPGSGLGLAIARSYARAHGGDVHHEDVVPRGARFELVLPQA